MRPSTWAFVRESRGLPGHSLFDRLHGYVYARWPYLYIGIGTGEHRLARILGPVARWILDRFGDGSKEQGAERGVAFADTYHGKAVPLEQATQLVTVDEEIRLKDLERVIPYKRARDIVLKNPDHIVVLDCPCRTSRDDPCQPLDVCLIIGEPFASFVADHHPQRSRWIESQEAVRILQEEDGRGHVHHAFFKDAMLERFYAICNCCACCCGAMQANRTGVPMLAPSGYLNRVDDDLCVGCGVCVEACPFEALSARDGVAVVDEEACMGCGVCVPKCEQDALTLVRDASRGEPLDIRELTAGASGRSSRGNDRSQAPGWRRGGFRLE
jgi:ferredoxin